MKINYYDLGKLTPEEKSRLLRRAEGDIDSLRDTVQPIITDVRERGDEALLHYNLLFDNASLKREGLKVSPGEFAAARGRLDPALRDSIDFSLSNIRKYHQAQMPADMWMMELSGGILAGEKITPISSVGLYVPRGKGSFPSVMMMLAAPAKIARVEKI